MSILIINELALQLVSLDFSDGHSPNNGGPTKTSRALAIIHLAAHDAYAQVTKSFAPFSTAVKLPEPSTAMDSSAASGAAALLGAGFRAATLLYPDFGKFIAATASRFSASHTGCCNNELAYKYGEQVAEAWVAERSNDGSQVPQLDSLYSSLPGRHRPDPINPKQETLGRSWGLVRPFALSDVAKDAPLTPPPPLNSPDYAQAFMEVVKDGKSDLVDREPSKAVVGIFWGYDGANKIGVPPRLYNQVVLAINEFKELSHEKQIRLLTAINVAMADAGIAAWHWKYQYDFWRPVVGIREAEAGWGPSGQGDGNSSTSVDPFWLPLGAPNSNPIKPGRNTTPGFPAYPSGHATFGAACFKTAAALLGKKPEDITLSFVSDEFNGVTTDNTGVVRPRYEATFNLCDAICQNNISRIYLGVHWSFDASGGEIVGTAIASKVASLFQ